ncbi:MAG: RNA-binding cell elongation regulator Jag/EloR [Eubacteriales bacterium]|nr:RNA-binding cell elongation regulator Jag/EloR [Eubacteriales bacterium]
MSQEYIEISEKTLDDAITSACQRLSVTSDRLDYVVIDAGSAGFLGFNSRPARIKARVKEAAEATEAILNDVLQRAGLREEKPQTSSEREIVSAPEKTGKSSDREEKVPAAEGEQAGKVQETAPEAAGEKEFSGKKEERVSSHRESTETNVEEVPQGERTHRSSRGKGRERGPMPGVTKIAPEKQLSDEKVAQVCAKAEQFLTEVFGAMKMEVKITTNFVKDLNMLNIDLAGDDMGILIGKRGQTLDSMQYLVSLVVNRETEGYIHVKADTENYRERRKQTLENLAKNIAYKVKRTKQPVTLEPMNPYERRIIHSALQSDRYVTTYSEGEEPFRKVVVTPKK